MKVRDLKEIIGLYDDYEYDTASGDEGEWQLVVLAYDKAPHGTITLFKDHNLWHGTQILFMFDDVTKLIEVTKRIKDEDRYHDEDMDGVFEEHGIDFQSLDWQLYKAADENIYDIDVKELEEIAMKTMTITNTAVVSVNAKEEVKMNKRYVVSMVIGSVVNTTQIDAVKAWLAKNAKASVDIIISGNPVRIQKLGKVIADMKVPARVIGCNVKNSDVFKYTHQDEHPCVWAINHSDVVFTIGDGMVVNEAKKYAFKANRSYYNYGRQFVESICKGHYDKAVITRADIVTTNEAKAIKAEEVKVAVKPKVDLIAVAKAEMDAAKKVYEAAKAKYDKLVATSKPAVKEKVVGRGKELFVDVELSSNMGDITKSFTEEQKKAEEEAVDEAVEAFMAKEESKPVEMRLELAEPVNGQTEAIVRLDENGLFVAEPVKADFTFEGKGYNVVVKEAFDVELFNSFDAETQKMVIEESVAAGHIVAA